MSNDRRTVKGTTDRNCEGGIKLEDTHLDDVCCLTCRFSEPKNEDKWGNPEFIVCNLTMQELSIEDFCSNYK